MFLRGEFKLKKQVRAADREDPGPPGANLLTTLAGPFFNLLLAATWYVAPDFGLMNLVFALTNLAPFAGSDGQRAWAMVTKGCREAGVEPVRWIADQIGTTLTSSNL